MKLELISGLSLDREQSQVSYDFCFNKAYLRNFLLYFSPFILANCACQARISEYTPADKDTENKGLNFPGVELMKVTRQNGKKILALISELGILSSILSTLSVPLVSREVSSEAPLLSGVTESSSKCARCYCSVQL